MSRDLLLPNDDDFRGLMAEAAKAEPHTPAVMGDRVVTMLEDAEQAGREWARPLLDRLTRQAAYLMLKNWMRRHSSGMFRTDDGRLLVKARIGSVTVRDPETGERVGTQLALFVDMSWAQLREWVAAAAMQRDSLADGIAMAARLLALQEGYPDSYGPAEACRLAGSSIDDVLAPDKAAS